MGFTIPTSFDVIGSDEDVTGRTQIHEGKAIGGGSNFDEWEIIVKNTRYCWASGNAAVLFNIFPVSYLSGGAIGTVLWTSYPAGRDVIEIPVDGAEKRPDFVVDYDIEEGAVKVEFFNLADVSLGSATGAATTTRNVGSFNLTGLTTPEDMHYAVVTVIPNTHKAAQLYGIRVLETEGDL